MASLYPNLDSSFQPQTSEDDVILQSVDFLPNCESPGGLFRKAVYEDFRSVVHGANEWLKANPFYQIKTCESVEFKLFTWEIKPEKMYFVKRDKMATSYARGLRLWVCRNNSSSKKIQQINYLNLIPEATKEGFETLDEMIKRYNDNLRMQPSPGRIITIETQEMKVKSYKEDIDPDKSNWIEYSAATRFLSILRIFYDTTESCSEEIGIENFTPNLLQERGIFSLPKYEMFSETLKKASDWCSRQQNGRICNVQSLKVKLKRGKHLDPQAMHYTEIHSFYVHIIRVAYVKLSYQESYDSPIPSLTCKTFVPFELTRGLACLEFESLQKTKERITAWVKATGVQVISAETVSMRLYGSGAKYGPETTVTFEQRDRDTFYLIFVRLYINGNYSEPHPNVLPPIPELQTKLCTIQ